MHDIVNSCAQLTDMKWHNSYNSYIMYRAVCFYSGKQDKGINVEMYWPVSHILVIGPEPIVSNNIL